MRRLRVMIVEDSRVIREFLTHVIGRDPRLEIVAAVDAGEKALRVLREIKPDVISMDIRLPGIDGFEATRQIMAVRPTPIVVVAGNVESGESRISIEALRAGALAVLEKPAGSSGQAYEAFAERLCTQLAIMSQVKVITQRTVKRDAADESITGIPTSMVSLTACQAVGIVASTGGPSALVEITRNLTREFPVPILLVQHMTSSFVKAFIDWMDDMTDLHVVEAHDGQKPEPGHIYSAPADRHLALRGRQLRLEDTPLVCLQRPSGTVLFNSMAESLGPAAVGVLLTGMGEDGAEGLLAMREAGGHTIAEDQSTAVVYGMPGAAAARGAVAESLPLPMIAPRLRQIVR